MAGLSCKSVYKTAYNDSEKTTEEKIRNIRIIVVCFDDVTPIAEEEIKDDNIVEFLGNTTFVGKKVTDKLVLSDKDGADALKDAAAYLGVSDEPFMLTNKQKSVVSGNTIYTYSVVRFTTIDGNEVGASTNRSIKLIVNESGEVIALSSNINSKQNSAYGDIQPIEKTAAVEKLKEKYGNEIKIVEDSVTLKYWQSPNEEDLYEGSNIPVWVIFVENEDTASAPYRLYCVSAVRNEMTKAYLGDDIDIVFAGDVPSLDILEKQNNDENETYLSDLYFDNFEDAGEYTYTLDLSVVKENADKSTPFSSRSETLEVTLPVMKNINTGLYYLGDKNRKIIVSNFTDLYFNATVNAVCSDNPEDVNSWHFEIEKNVDEVTYFFDSGYVLSAYNSMITAHDTYEKIYGLKSVNSNDLPICVMVYTETSGEYPADLSGFRVNASNAGVLNEWSAFLTSPNCPLYLDSDSFCHEYAHGINERIQVLGESNEVGAISEAYGDILGYLSDSTRKEKEDNKGTGPFVRLSH